MVECCCAKRLFAESHYAECLKQSLYADCRYAECHLMFSFPNKSHMLSVVMLNVVMLSVSAQFSDMK